MSTETDFNVPPYNDDFDETKNFHRVIHRPSTPIQARELTQSQTISQNQIERMGKHFFKDGTIVEGVAITYYPRVHYISLEDNFNTNTSTFASNVDSTYVITNSTNSNNACRAVVKIAKDGSAAAAPYTNRWYLSYIVTGTDGSNNDVSYFVPGDTLYVYNSNQNKFGTLDANNLVDSIDTLASNGTFTSNGFSYCLGVSDGLIFQKGFMVRVEEQIINVKDFDTNVHSYGVGFNTIESIVTENEDETLFDNSLGYPNENAPGAHRLKLTPTLISKELSNTSSNSFFAIVEFSGTEPNEQRDSVKYNALEKQFAVKTYEESGNYVINPFSIETRVNEANAQTFYYDVSPGVAYVRGYRVEKIGPTKVEAPRALTTDVSENQIISANYGSYVICNEFVGTFDTEQLSEVTLYDTEQRAITDKEGTTTSPTGTAIGTANIRAVVFNSGTKGNSAATFYLYLFNIRMDSGKSFASDVKSIYHSGTFGIAKADLVLESGIVVLKDSSASSLVFNSGLFATKRLTNNTGIGDTTYTYHQIKSGTMNSSGAVTISLDTAASGASSEKLTDTSNVTSSAALAEYNAFFSNGVYSANQTGTIEVVSGNTQIIGTGTSFGDSLTNTLIRIYANTTQTYVRKVLSVANTTVLNIDTPISEANTSTKYQNYYAAGSPIPLANVIINSNTSFTANFNNTMDSGSQTVYVQYPVYRNQAVAIPKLIKKNVVVKIDCSNNVANSVGPWNLGFPDVHKIKHVYLGTTFSNTNSDRLDWFNLDTGQKDDLYDHSKLQVLPDHTGDITGASKLLVVLDHFVANTDASVGFFSVDSYPIDDANTANVNAIQTLDLPIYKNTELRNYVDFRPMKANTAVSTTTEGSATINPAYVNSTFSIDSGGQYLIAPDTNFLADFEYYLPRIDIITMDSTGTLNNVRGVPSVKPRPPFVEADQMVIAESFVPAFPTATQREYELYETTPSIKVAVRDNRRYTMQDMRTLDQRVKRLEFHTVLNTLEQQARDLTIPDVNGLDRFKNGIFADPFNSHNIGNVSDFEYKIAIDADNSIARPLIEKNDIDFVYTPNTSSDSVKSFGVVKKGPVVLLNYENVELTKQRFATKYRNAAQSQWQWNGICELYPALDFFRDETPPVNVNQSLDLAAPWEQFATTPFAQIFGDWRTTSTQINVQQSTTQSGFLRTTATTTTTSTNQESIVQRLKIDTFNQPMDFGTTVKDFSIQPYMRSRLVSFVARSLKPNTTLHAFFDDINVDQYCAPGVLSDIVDVQAGQEDRYVSKSGDFGDDLVSDANGFVCGVFMIPAETFRTGDRTFQLTNIDNILTGDDARITTARARFTADSTSITRQSTTLNVRQPLVSHNSITQTRTLVGSRTDISVVDLTPQPPSDWVPGNDDPIAQSFSVSNIPDYASGIFLPAIGVYFKSKSSSLGCNLYVCEMTDNFPDMSKILAFSYLDAADINVSDDGTEETLFEFDYPVYLLKNNDYAFVVQPVGSNPDYDIWVAETGDFDIATNEQVFANPSTGVLFFSANRKTWTPVQLEDIKYNLYRANFTSNSGYAVFKNENDEYLTINGITRDNPSLSISVGDIVYTINSTANTSNAANIVSFTLISGPSGRVQWIDEATNKLWIDSSNGGFSVSNNNSLAIYRTSDYSNTSLLSANTLVGHTSIVSIDNLDYHAVVPKFGVLQPLRTTTSFNIKGTKSSGYTVDSTYLPIQNEYELELTDSERYVVSKSNEVANMSSAKSVVFKIDMETASEYVSPVIDLSRKSMLFIENRINNDATNEHTRYGNALTKYVSKRVVLDEGQDAEDLELYLTASRPPDTDVKIYGKFWNSYDPDSFDDKVWSEMTNLGNTKFTSASNVRDYVEYKFKMPSSNTVDYGTFANNGSVSYNTLAGSITIESSNNIITGVRHTFNSSTGVSNTADTIAITNANSFFRVQDRIVYNANGNTEVTGLANGSIYYISFANATHVALSSTKTGSNIDVTSVSSSTQYIQGTFFTEDFDVGDRIKIQSGSYTAIRTITGISNNEYMTVDNSLEQSNSAGVYYVFNSGGGDGVVEYTSQDGSRYVGYKEFAIKIVLLSSNPVLIPRLNDVRGICLQV